jgi:hypothetical protein
MGEVASAHFQITPESARAAIARADESMECRAFAAIIKFGSRFGLAKNAIAVITASARRILQHKQALNLHLDYSREPLPKLCLP